MEITLQQALSRIEQANDIEINHIMAAVQNRFAVVYPDWEVLYISFPKHDPIERQRTLEYMITYFQSHT